MALHYGRVPLNVTIDLDGEITEELDEKLQDDSDLMDIFAMNILSGTKNDAVSYDVEYDGDGSFLFSSRVEMPFSYGSVSGYWDDETGGCPPDSWCDMDDSSYDEKSIASAIASELPDYLHGMKVRVSSFFDNACADINPEPVSPW